MTSYIIRRLLLMVPTLLGITFMIFMLIALSPGGIGAALQAGQGAMEASSRAEREAYLEERYGLDDPAVVQYLRWLGRISPIKFGQRDQVAPSGEMVRPPRLLKPPPLAGSWYAADGIPRPPMVERAPEAAASVQDRQSAFAEAARAYSEARSAYAMSRIGVQEALRRYAALAGLKGATKPDGKIIESVFVRAGPDESTPELAAAMSEVRALGEASVEVYRVALERRKRLIELFDIRPYPEDGVGLIPGVVSLALPDLGTSFSKSQPVKDLIRTRLPVTLMLNLLAVPLIYLIAIPSGMLAATRQGTWIDTLSGALFVALWSIPVVWAGVLMIGFLASDRYLGWFPVAGLHSADADRFAFLPTFGPEGFHRGYVLDTLWHICLPVACIVYGGFAILSKQTRAAMLENFNADYVRTAKAKGVAGRDIVFRHVFRNSLLPLITMFATVFPAMFSGSVVVERIFSIPGMGSLILESINLRDRELLLANVTMIGVVNLLALLMADILYAMADPRISYK